MNRMNWMEYTEISTGAFVNGIWIGTFSSVKDGGEYRAKRLTSSVHSGLASFTQFMCNLSLYPYALFMSHAIQQPYFFEATLGFYSS